MLKCTASPYDRVQPNQPGRNSGIFKISTWWTIVKIEVTQKKLSMDTKINEQKCGYLDIWIISKTLDIYIVLKKLPRRHFLITKEN